MKDNRRLKFVLQRTNHKQNWVLFQKVTPKADQIGISVNLTECFCGSSSPQVYCYRQTWWTFTSKGARLTWACISYLLIVLWALSSPVNRFTSRFNTLSSSKEFSSNNSSCRYLNINLHPWIQIQNGAVCSKRFSFRHNASKKIQLIWKILKLYTIELEKFISTVGKSILIFLILLSLIAKYYTMWKI